MISNWLVAFIVMLQGAFEVRRNAQFRFLTLQVDLMKKRLPGNRVILDPDERQSLTKIGAEFGHAVHDVLSIVSIKTYQRWQRDEKSGKTAKKVGRPKISKSLRDMIIKLAKQNERWGLMRILGELKKLSLKTSYTTIRRVLRAEKLMPDPKNRAPKGVDTPWRKFVAVHMNVMCACDFFTKSVWVPTIWTPLATKAAYVLAFIHLGSRRVFLSPSTFHPTGEWVKQQARNASMWAEENGFDIRFLIHDRDKKFTEEFDAHFERDDGGPVLTPPRAPVANAYAESFGGKLKSEVLNHVFCFGLRQLDYVCQNYTDYFNNYRPHQGLGNQIPGRQPMSNQPSNEQSSGDQSSVVQIATPPMEREIDHRLVKRKSWLGGLLRHYERRAA